MIELAVLSTLLLLSLVAAVHEFRSGDFVYVGRRWGIIPHRIKLTRHICVYGPTRSGKTSFIRALVKDLSKSYTVTILDWHGEYTDIENIPSIPYSKLKLDIDKIPLKLLVEVLGHGLNLNEPSLYMLYKMLKNSKIETIEDIVKTVEEYFATTRTEAEMKAAILRRLEYVLSSLTSGVIDVELLARYSCSVDLSDLTVIEEKRLAASLILATLYVHYMNSGLITGSVKHVIVVEEAQNFFSNDPATTTILDHVIMELGKYGVRVVLVTNVMPPPHILKHCVLVLFKVRPEQLERNFVLSDELERILVTMREDEAVIISPEGLVRVVPIRDRGRPEHIKTRVVSAKPAETKIESVSTTVQKPLTAALTSTPSAREVEWSQRASSSEHSSRLTIDETDIQSYMRRIDEIEKKLALIRERLDEIERAVAYEDELLNRILSVLEKRD